MRARVPMLGFAATRLAPWVAQFGFAAAAAQLALEACRNGRACFET